MIRFFNYYLKYLTAFTLPVYMVSIALDLSELKSIVILLIASIFSCLGVIKFFDGITEWIDDKIN